MEFVLVFEGMIQTTGNVLHARTSYMPNEILWGRIFSEMTFRDDNGRPVVDWVKQVTNTYLNI
eukprot:m.233383 g.233383  ORF g.233383 m.233383 type:complete len:63 (-) comp16026_c0_seq3:368-556(-)